MRKHAEQTHRCQDSKVQRGQQNLHVTKTIRSRPSSCVKPSVQLCEKPLVCGVITVGAVDEEVCLSGNSFMLRK